METSTPTSANMASENITSYEQAIITFSWYDYTLFTMMLAMSALIGVYFGFIKTQSSAKDYLLGGKEMKVFPIAMSLIASSISGVTLLAVPADIYRFGATYWLCAPTMIIVVMITYFTYIPVFYELQITSMYEYLKLRFNTKIRTFSSLVFTISIMLYLPIVIYIPALALSQATGINIHLITPVICGVCIFYTTIGGLKAVVWTDTLQFVVMIGAIVAVFVMGVASAGGFGVVWQISKQYGRLDLDFDLDITKRDTFWTGTVALTFLWMCFVGTNQGFIQKCLSLPTYNDVRTTLVIFSIGMVTVISFSVFTGLIMFAKYSECDPLTAGVVQQPDQLLPYYVMDVARSIPGLPGLFISGIFSAALSTLSAVLNSLAGTVYEDFVSPFMPKDISQKRVSTILKLLVTIIGVISTILVFVIEHMGSILPLAFTLGGITAGPLLGLFSVGLLVPMANAKGALYGGITSLVVMTWIASGSQWYKSNGIISYPTLPLSVENCPFILNSTIDDEKVLEVVEDLPLFLYRISYYYYAMMGSLIVFIVTIPISYFTDSPPVNKKCLSPLVRYFSREESSDPPEYYSVEKALNMVKVISKEESK